MKETKNNVMAVIAAEKRNTYKTNTAKRRGWNWEYAFSEKVMPDGTRRTLVVEYQLLHRKYATDVIVSSYTGGHPYEDAAFEAIGDAFRDFFQETRENGIVCKEVRERTYLTGWLVDAPIDSEMITTLVASLATINRVSVISTPRKEEEK